MSRTRRTVLGIEDYVEGIASRDRAVLGRAITLVESHRPDHRQQAQALLSRLLPRSGASIRLGITGVPGVGKSTFIESLGSFLIDRGHRVAVLAVDPSSSVSGGSILGDKTRMPELSRREEAFIRPSPSRGSLGGVGRKTRETIIVCEAAGFDVVIVETVGVGQSETLVAEMVDFFLVLLLAGAGDELQGIKRGILELADALAITKADGDNLERARRARAEFDRALHLLRPSSGDGWAPRVLACSALARQGLDQIWETVLAHRSWLVDSGRLEERRRTQQLRWMWTLVDDELQDAVRRHPAVAELRSGLEQEVLEGRLSPTAAAEKVLEAFGVTHRS
jgi:LAO/AO transport system kinase